MMMLHLIISAAKKKKKMIGTTLTYIKQFIIVATCEKSNKGGSSLPERKYVHV